MKKKLLLVIQDHLEFKFIMNDYFLPILLRKFKITLMCPVNKDESFRKSILSKYPTVNFLNIPPLKIWALDKATYWLRSELFFILNSNKSESCFQKVFLNLELPFKSLLRKKLDNEFNKTYPLFFNNNYAKILLKIFLIPVSIPLTLFKRYIFSQSWFFTKGFSKDKFDYIFYGSPYSLANIMIYKIFTHSNTRIISLCRNLDTPALKGIFIIPSDYTVVFDKFLYEHLISLNDPLNYGKIILYEHPVKFFKKEEKKKDEKGKNILYASSVPNLIPNESKTVENLYSFLSKELRDNFTLFLRIHPNDDIDRYKKFYLKKNIILEKNFYKYRFKDFMEKKRNFPTLVDVEDFYNKLQEMDLVLSSGSTINYEAYLLKVKTAYLKLSKDIDWIFKRDHLKILTEKYKIPILEDIRELKKFL